MSGSGVQKRIKYLQRFFCLLQWNVHIYEASVLALNVVICYSRVSVREHKIIVNFNGSPNLNITTNDLNDIYKISTFYKISKYEIFIYYKT